MNHLFIDSKQKKGMGSKKWTIGFAVLVILALGIILLYNNRPGQSTGQYDDFAKCLTEKGVKMYGTEWCSHCKNQKALFGESFKYVDFVDCDAMKELCLDAGVRGYPTWYINSTLHAGEQSLSDLSKMSGCELNMTS